jgi:DNA polymerase I
VKQHLQLAGPDGMLHCSINPIGARTGRMSASRPNLQNLPRDDTRIRQGFVARPGHVLISADYDQIEGRLFAHFSGDANMLASIRYGDEMTAAGRKGFDMHSMAARMIYKIGPDQDVPKDRRTAAKTGQFSKIYGVGLETFAGRNGMTIDEARAFFRVYETEFPETAKSGFQSRVTKRLIDREREVGEAYVLTAYGRKEPCWPSSAYKAVNYLIQGTAADVMKDRMVALSKTWLGPHIVMTIHDELIFEINEDAVYEAVRTIREVMPERERFAVPLTVDVEVMRRWGGEPLPLPAVA